MWARLLLALIALVAFALPSGIAQADTLVSNIGQATSSGTATVTSTQSQAQAFTTGSGGGYDLEAVGVEVRSFAGAADDISDISVGIYSVTSGRPGSLVHTLSNPSAISSGVRTFTAPANATLDENKTYFVVVSYAGSASFVLRTTSVNNEDSGAATGWSLADSRTLGSGTSWSTNPNALQIRVKGSDNTPPVLDGAEVNVNAATQVQLEFDEALDSGSLPAVSAFSVTVDGSPRTIDSLTLNGAGTTVTLTVDPAIRPGDAVRVSYTKPSRKPLQDEGGSDVASFTNQAVTNDLPPVKPDAPTLRAKGASTGQIDLSWALAYTGGAAITGYRIEVSTTGAGGWSDLVANTNSTSRRYSHTELNPSDTRHYRVSAINSVGTGDPSNVASGRAMNTPPTVISSETSRTGESVILFLDEAPYSRSTPDKSAFTVKVDGNAFTPTNAFFLAPSRIVLTLASPVRPGETVTVSYTKPSTNPLQDAGGLETESFTDFPVENNIPPIEPDAPTNLQARGVSTTKIDLFWDAPANTRGADITGYRIEVSTTGTGGWSELVADTSSTSTRYSHTVPSGAMRHYRVSAINSAGTGTASDVASASAMNTPPGVTRAEVATTLQIGMLLDEAPDLTSTPDKSAFTVKVKGNARTPAGAFILANPPQVRLTFASNDAVRPGETVTVSYTKPLTNPLRDAAGLETASFTDFPVENKLAPIAPDAPTNLHAKDVSATEIGLSWRAPAYTGGGDITGYRIEVSTTGTGGWSDLVADTGSTSTTYSHTVPSGATRHYRVSAINSTGAGTASDVASASAMNTPPGVTRAEVATTLQIGMLLDEAPDLTSAPDKSAFTVKVEGNARTPAGAFILANPPQVRLTFASNDAVRPGETVTVSYTKPLTNPLRDAAGLETASFTDFPVENKLAPIAPDAPTNLNAEGVSRTNIDLSWDAPAYTGGEELTGYRIEVSTTGAGGWSDLVADTGSTSTTYSHTGLSSGDTRYYRVSAINSAGAGDPSAVASGTAPDLPPTVTRAEVATTLQIGVLLDEAPDLTSTPDKSAFTVKVEGNARTPAGAFILANPPQVRLTFASNDAVRPGETVTVSYTKPGTNPLRDAAGIETASFTDFPVENKLAPIAPDAPTNLQAKGVSAGEIDLSWDAPAYTGGTDITGYRIEVSTTGTGGWSDLVADTSSTSTTYLHTGLNSGDTRHYRVSAINSAGAGDPSNVSSDSAMDNTPPVLESAEAGIVNDTTFIVLEFSEALDLMSVAAKSAFTVKVEGSAVTVSAAQLTTDQTLLRLTLANNVNPGANVTVSYTKPGANPLRDISQNEVESFTDQDVTGPPANAPDAPTNLQATGVSETRIDLSWNEPGNTGGADIVGYRIEVSTTGTGGWSDLVADTGSTARTYSHTGLELGDTRHYRVSALNSAGAGDPSNVASGSTMDITPPVLRSAKAGIVNDTTFVVLEFSEALDATSVAAKSAFTVKVDGNAVTVSAAQITTDRTVVRLTLANNASPGATVAVSYAKPGANPLRDIAQNEVESFTDQDVTDLSATAPDAPELLVRTGDGFAELSWTPVANDSPVLRYEVRRRETPDGTFNAWTSVGLKTSYRVEGLTNGQAYEFQVRGVNALGNGEEVSAPGTPKAPLTQQTDITTPTLNRDGSHTLWSATLTVGKESERTTGYNSVPPGFGGLSTDTFSHNGGARTVVSVQTTPNNRFLFNITPRLNDLGNATLHVGTETFAFEDATPSGTDLLQWTILPSWSEGDKVAVRLVRANEPGTAPRNLHAKSHSATQIDLSWRAPSKTGGSDITGYRIEVSTDGGNNWSDLVADTGATLTRYMHTVPSGATRHYRVSAINAVGTGPVSNVASATATATSPGLASAVVERTNSLTVRLEFDEPVDTDSIPDKSAFAVQVEETPLEVTSFTVEKEGSDAGRLGRLVLATRVRPGQTVTLSYTKPGTDPLKDSEGNEMVSFTDYSVTNETSTVFPDLSVRDERTRESGNGTPTTMTFTVRLDTESEFPVGVYYETEDVTATGGASCSGNSPPDYISTKGRLSVGPGISSKAVEVTICDDPVNDTGERLRLVLYSTQLHESIDELGEIGPEGKSYKNADGEDEETASATGTILNSESDAVVSIAADTTYGEEGSDAVFTLRRAGDAETELTVPVTVEETGAMLDGDAPESVTFAAQSREAVLRLATEDDGVDETDSKVTATVQAGATWHLAEEASSAELTVLDNDTAPVASTSSADVTIWSADMTVVEYGAGAIGAGTADLFSNQQGSAGLSAKWLWYDPSKRELKIAFDDGLDDAGSMTLHVGGLSVSFPADSGGDSSFTIPNVDVSWSDGATLAAWVTKPSAEAVSTDATLASLTVSGATLSPAFDAGVLVYRVEVAAETETVTIAATASDGGASIAYGPGEDADTALADFQISTPSGETLVEVTVTAADGRTARSYRVVLARAAANTAPSGLPEISGTPEVGETFTASVAAIADADGTDNATFAYQWLAHDGTDDMAIAGATGATHEVAADDAGKALKVRVTFTDDKGTEEVLVSAATETVVDRRPVAATLSVGDGAAEAGRFRLGIAFGDAVTGLALADLAASRVGGGTAAVSELTETGRVWTAWVAADAGRYTVRLPAGAAQSGERQSLAAVLAVDVDADGNATAVAEPVVTSVALATASDGTWTDGETVRLTLTFSEPVTVATGGGTPTVGIALGGSARQASYAGGSGTASLAFAYAVTADDGTVSSVSLTADSLALNGGTIRDAGAHDADLEHPGISTAVTEDTEPESASPLTGLVLVDTASGAETALADGDALVLADPANGSWGLVASVAPEAQVGSVVLALTGANTGIAATDDAAPYSLHGDEDGTVTGAGLPAGSYTLSATTYPEADGAGAALGTLSVSFTVSAGKAVAPDALAASFEGVPEAHGGLGSEAFTFRVRFSLEPRVSYAVLRDESFAVTGGGVRKARRVDGRNDLREIHVEPEGWDDVRVTLPGGRACGTEGAICTADGKVLANTAVATVPGPLALSVADAEAQEGADPTLDFAVTLNRAASGTVTVDYATSDGTATAGADYTAASGTLTFAPGETAKTVNVPVLDDAHDDDGETLTLTLSNASGARIRDGEATGTIENSDPIPQAWLARFGRTVADHVVDAIGARLTGSSGGGSQVTLGGERVALDGSAGGAAPGADRAAGDEEAAARDALTAFADRIGGTADGGARERGAGDALFGDGWTREGASATERSLTGRELLLGSSFVLNLSGDGEGGAAAAGTRWTAWGRASSSRFDGEADGLVLDGDVTTFTLGADAAWDRWLAGVAVALSEGTGGFRDHEDTGDPNHPDRGSGALESTLTSVHPYARLEVSERLSLWGLLGYGTGELDVAVDGVGRWSTDTTQEMAAAGARGVLVKAPETGGFELGLRGDAVVQRMHSDAARGEAGNLAAADARTSRLRLALEGSRAVALEDGGRFVPTLEVGLRQDGGDAETGTGVELGGGLAWADPARGLTVEAKARTLIAHEDADYREWGVSGSVRIEPGASGRGLSLTLAPAWGAAEGGAERLWSLRDARGLAPDAEAPGGSRLEAELGYGFAVFGDRGVTTPYAGLSRSETGETLRLGQSLRLGASQWKVESAFGEAERAWGVGYGYRLGQALDLSVEATRREATNDDAPEHGVMLRLGAHW